MDRITLKKIENFFKQKFNSKKIKIEGRANKNDSAEVLIDNEFIPGYHTTFWNANGKSSGVYFIQLATDNYINSQKILFLK